MVGIDGTGGGGLRQRRRRMLAKRRDQLADAELLQRRAEIDGREIAGQISGGIEFRIGGDGERRFLAKPGETVGGDCARKPRIVKTRSEEHTSELQSLMRISYAVFCLK